MRTLADELDCLEGQPPINTKPKYYWQLINSPHHSYRKQIVERIYDPILHNEVGDKIKSVMDKIEKLDGFMGWRNK